ncbi:MAG TPA: hypothetical protein VI230_07560, partial [Ignavibacteriaceae bacterium]
LFAVIAVPSFSQEAIDSTEIIAEVPAVDQFHDVIYPIWHVAYPSKDYAALRSYVDDIDKGAQKIYDAQLPGILQDKQEIWNKGVDEFKVTVEEYKKLAADKDDEMLLKAAENLHSKYESLVRIIHPVLPELDQFHQVLYMIYHKYLPQEDYQQIYLVSDDLVEKSEALTKTKLNTEDAELQKKFDNYTEQLFHSSQKLREQLKSNNYEMVKLGVEDVHRIYQKIESLFENK